MKFSKKPVTIEATQWFKLGDHAMVKAWKPTATLGRCESCQRDLSEHGMIDTLEGVHIVCPGDWVIRGVKGEFYACKPDIFQMTYEAAE